jgi:hypothetical protein
MPSSLPLRRLGRSKDGTFGVVALLQQKEESVRLQWKPHFGGTVGKGVRHAEGEDRQDSRFRRNMQIANRANAVETVLKSSESRRLRQEH